VMVFFGAWAAGHGKVYGGEEEAAARAAVWEDNRQFVERENAAARAAGRSLRLDLNEFSDLTWEEFRAPRLGTSLEPGRRGSLPQRAQTRGPFVPGNVTVPLNWVERGAVTPVKDQGQCGSCWSFSTTGAIEGVNALYYKRHGGNDTDALEAVSEQELVDCDTADSGCNGGLMDYAFSFVVENDGIDTEKDYPYDARVHSCDVPRRDRRVVTIDGHVDVQPGNETALMRAVRRGPVSIAIEADQRAFQFYSGGVFDAPCGDSLDHGVLIVGYGKDEDSDQDYWLVKNSWGASWGDQGYIKLAMGIAPSGQCGLTSMASYPVKKSPNPPRPPPTPPSPPPPPPPTQCDQFNTCPSGNTCCCVLGLSDRCLFWGCCPLKDAVCCKDHQTCCAEGTVCDPNGPGCLSKRTNLKSGSGARASTYQREGALFEAALKMELAENSRRPSGIAEH